MNGPKQGSTEQIIASALTNPTLSIRLTMLKNNRREFDKNQADAFLEEAARRLYWADAYLKHAPQEDQQEIINLLKEGQES